MQTAAETIVAAVSRPPAYQIITALHTNGPMYFGDLADQTETPTATLTRTLRTLEELDIIQGDVPPAARRGRAVRYSANISLILEATDAFRATLN